MTIRPCLEPQCPALVRDGARCHRHQREHEQRDRQQRGTAHQRGYDRDWQEESAEYLRQHPLCEGCLVKGRRVMASLVDHRVAIRDGGAVHHAAKQSLCRSCHGLKTAEEVRQRRVGVK